MKVNDGSAELYVVNHGKPFVLRAAWDEDCHKWMYEVEHGEYKRGGSVSEWSDCMLAWNTTMRAMAMELADTRVN